MPLSQVYGAQSLIKAGVCTSSSRPASPFEGQLIYETDTDRLAAYNGSAWIGQNGLSTVQPETTITSALTITLDNCFTSSFTNYRIHLNVTGATSNNAVIQLRSGGTTATGSNYVRQYIDATNTTVSANRVSGTSIDIGYADNDFRSTFILEVFQPALAQYTNFYAQNIYSSGASTTAVLWYQSSSIHNLATAYDGFIITCGSAMTGTYSVYGYGK